MPCGDRVAITVATLLSMNVTGVFDAVSRPRPIRSRHVEEKKYPNRSTQLRPKVFLLIQEPRWGPSIDKNNRNVCGNVRSIPPKRISHSVLVQQCRLY